MRQIPSVAILATVARAKLKERRPVLSINGGVWPLEYQFLFGFLNSLQATNKKISSASTNDDEPDKARRLAA